MTTKNPKFDAFMSDLRAALCAQYEASESLRAEFPTADIYIAFTLNEPTARPLVRRWRGDFDAAAAERALVDAEARGNVRKAAARRAAGRFQVAR